MHKMPTVDVIGSAGGAANATTAQVAAKDVQRLLRREAGAFDVSIDIADSAVTALIGPSGCGKSTFLRCINRMNDMIPICRVTGKIVIDGRTSTTRRSMWCSCAPASAWCSRNPTRSPSRSTRMSPTVRGSTGCARQVRTRGYRPSSLREGRPVERGQGPPARYRHGAFGRAAAAAVHRARDRGQSRGDPDGRALFGARPHRHGQVEELIDELQVELHHHHRHALDAAGGPRFTAHGVFPPWPAG